MSGGGDSEDMSAHRSFKKGIETGADAADTRCFNKLRKQKKSRQMVADHIYSANLICDDIS